MLFIAALNTNSFMIDSKLSSHRGLSYAVSLLAGSAMAGAAIGAWDTFSDRIIIPADAADAV